MAVSFSAARSAKLDSILASYPKPYESDLLQVMTGERSHTSGGIVLACGTLFRAFCYQRLSPSATEPCLREALHRREGAGNERIEWQQTVPVRSDLQRQSGKPTLKAMF